MIQKVRHYLNLKTIRTEEISIDSFGEQSTELKQSHSAYPQNQRQIN